MKLLSSLIESGRAFLAENTITCGIIVAGLVGLVTIRAASPPYITASAGGNTAAGAQVIMPADAASQLRIVNVYHQCDTNRALLNFRSGTTLMVISASNSASATITVSQTNGVAINDVLVLKTAATGAYTYLGAVTNRSASTNLLISTLVTTVPGDSIYKLGNPLTIVVSQTNYINGSAVYVASQVGRPIVADLPIANATNNLTLTAHYD